ncbi:MAG TPA: protein kinase, partial [Bryobacteraceae bacterium]|nr:protein kinase [Bryobacteraceae bacterium]
MSTEQRAQIEALFHAALERKPADRAVFLAEACSDAGLREQVEALILERENADCTQTLPAAGTQLGPYRIEGLLGAGGMGEVFRAVDTRLGRLVAIKRMHQRFSERFEREARAISALNHPNICTLYDVGPDYLVMEFCQGQTLADRIRKGAVPPAEVLRIGAQIAAAMAEAHAKGIVHRDLKPANVMLTKSGVKVLDFGLAKSHNDATLTVDHAVLGTPAYMAPEQREGLPVDHRTDIYALGLVLAEMATGKRGVDSRRELESQQQLAWIIERCLEIDPGQRWQSAADISHQLTWLAQPSRRNAPADVVRGSGGRYYYALAFLGIALATGFASARWIWPVRQSAGTAGAVHFTLTLDAFTDNSFEPTPILSPDGRYLAFVGKQGAGKSLVWIRAIAQPEAHALPGTDGATTVFWSPDSRWVGFFVPNERRVMKVAPEGGPPQTMFPIATGFQEAVWGGRGDIVYRPLNREPLYRISESGGAPVQVTTLDKERTENSHRGLQFLPDGRRFLFTARCANRAMNALYLGSLDTGKTKRLGAIDSTVHFAATSDAARGRVFYYRDGALVSRTLNLISEQLEGEPAVIINKIGYNPTGLLIVFDTSADDRIRVWRDSAADLPGLFWYTRSGERQGELGKPDNRISIRLSPDGRHVAYAGLDPQTGNRDVFLMDTSRGIVTRLTDNVANEWYPVWSPDSKTVAFVSDRPGGGTLSRSAIDTTAPEVGVYQGPYTPEDWSLDGRWIGGFDSLGDQLWAAEARAGAKPVTLAPIPHSRRGGMRFSPDARWVAYVSDESGDYEVYVRRFFGSSVAPEAFRVSQGGGDFPIWNPKGGELFFVSGDRTLWSVDTRNLEKAPPPEPARMFRLCEAGAFVNGPF